MSPAAQTAIPDAPRPRAKFFVRVRQHWGRIRARCAQFWSRIRPGWEARKGAVWAFLIAGFCAAAIGGYYLDSGFGLWIDLAFAFAVAALGIPLLAMVAALVLTILRKLPRMAAGEGDGRRNRPAVETAPGCLWPRNPPSRVGESEGDDD